MNGKKRISYSKIARTILQVTAMRGQPQRLKMVVRDICHQMQVGLSDVEVKQALGDYCVTRVYDREDGVRVVEDWVVYGCQMDGQKCG